MLRVPRDKLNELIEAFLIASHYCTDCQGLRIINRPDPKLAEAAILGALSTVAPLGGPVTPSDVFYLTGFGRDENPISFPPQQTNNLPK